MKFDTRDKKPHVFWLLIPTAAAAAAVGILMARGAQKNALPICLIMAAYCLSVIGILMHAFREQLKYNPYSYNTIIYVGFSLFTLSVMVTYLVLTVRLLQTPGFAGQTDLILHDKG